MAKGMNKVILIGHLGQDPEIKYTQSGSAVANFSLATTEKWSKDGEKREKTEWHRIVAWRKLAEIIGEWCHKGDLIMIEGKLQTDKWQKEGVDMYTTKIIADQMLMLGSKGGGGERQDRPEPHDDYQAPTTADDDIPF